MSKSGLKRGFSDKSASSGNDTQAPRQKVNAWTFAKLKEEVKKVELKRDPFSAAPIEIYQGPQLQGVLWDQNHPTAIINGQIVAVGDKMNGNRVVDIKRDRVILNNGVDNLELILGQ